MRFLSPQRTVALGVVAACVILAAAESSAEPLAVDDAVPAPAPGGAEQRKEVTDAIERFKNMDFEGALAKFKEAASKDPNLPPGEVLMAELFNRVNQPAALRLYLERAVIEAPEDPQAYAVLGDLYLRERGWAAAGLLLDKAHVLMKTFDKSAQRKQQLEPLLYNGLAAVAKIRGEWDAAQKHLEDLLKLQPDNADAMQQLGEVLFQRNQPTEAKDQLKAAYEAVQKNLAAGGGNPNLPHWGARMGQLYEQAGDRPQAEKWMDFAKKAAPNDLTTQLVVGDWALRAGQIDLAEEQATTAYALDRNSLSARLLRGVVALFKKQYATAENYFASALEDWPSSFAAKNNLALALCEQDDRKKRRALAHAEDNVHLTPKNDPNYAEAMSTYGWVLYKSGKVKEADDVLKQLPRGGRIGQDTVYYVARVAAEMGRLDQARTMLDSALKSDSPFAQREEAQALVRELSR